MTARAPHAPALPETPSQTAGPYVHIGLMPRRAGLPALPGQPGPRIAGEGEGEAITLEGTVLDGTGAPVRDGLIELHQGDGAGRPRWARAAADFETGRFRFETVRPAALPDATGQPQAPHLSLLIFARGINMHLHTRAYLPGDAAALAADPVLAAVAPERRGTLLAKDLGGGRYRFDIRLQGADETVFLDL